MSGQGGYNYIQKNYLTIEALESGLQAKVSKIATEYCINGSGNWTKLAANTYTPAINQGETISFRANDTTTIQGIGIIGITKRCNLLGNIMSIRYGDDARTTSNITKSYAFYEAFRGQPIVSVSKDFLPATGLASDCYSDMFFNCTQLISAPDLPAASLYSYCYSNMFYGCSSLTTAPYLPAKSLTNRCYNYMFYGCSKLSYIKAMFTTQPTTSYTNSWVSRVASSGTFVKSASASWNVMGDSGVPRGWTIVKE